MVYCTEDFLTVHSHRHSWVHISGRRTRVKGGREDPADFTHAEYIDTCNCSPCTRPGTLGSTSRATHTCQAAREAGAPEVRAAPCR